MKNVEVIGEAANMLTHHFREVHNELPWRPIINMRNVLVHGYYIASPLFIWETYTNDLGPLLEQVKGFIKAPLYGLFASSKFPRRKSQHDILVFPTLQAVIPTTLPLKEVPFTRRLWV